jgi:hypothetical protein
MASSSPSLCQHLQCDAFQFTICRHCQLFLCIKHLAEHQQQFPSDFQRLLDDARRQQAQLSAFDTRLTDQRLKLNPIYDQDLIQINPYIQSKVSLQQTATFISEHDNTQFDEECLFASFGGLIFLLNKKNNFILVSNRSNINVTVDK